MLLKILAGTLLAPVLLIFLLLMLLQAAPTTLLRPVLGAFDLQMQQNHLELDLLSGQLSTSAFKLVETGSNRTLVQVGKLQAEVIWSELLQGNNINATLHASDIGVFLPPATEQEEPEATEPGLQPAEIFSYRGLLPGLAEINNLSVHWGSAETPSITTLDSAVLRVLPAGAGIDLAVTGQQLDIPVEIEARIDGLQELPGDARQFALTLRAEAPQQAARLALKGTITAAPGSVEYDTNIDFKMANLATLVELLALDFELQGVASLEADLRGNLHEITLSNSRLTLANPAQYQLSATGGLDYPFADQPELDFALQVNLTDMSVIQQFTAVDISLLGQASGSAAVSGPLDDLRLQELQLKSDDSQGLTLAAQGQLYVNRLLDAAMGAGDQLDLAATLPNLQPLQPWIGTAPIDPGDWSLNARLLPRDDGLAVDNLELQTGNRSTQALTISGAIADISGALRGEPQSITGLDLEVALYSASSTALTSLVDTGATDVPELGPVSASTRVTGSVEQLLLQQLQVNAGAADSTRLAVTDGKLALAALPEFELQQMSLPLVVSVSSTSKLSGLLDDVIADLGAVDASATLQQDTKGLSLEDLRLRLHRGNNTLMTVRGSIDQLTTLEGVKIQGQLTGLETQQLIASLLDKSFQQIQAGTLHGDFNIVYDPDNIRISQLDIRNQGAPGLQLQVKGTAQFDSQVSAIDMHLETNITDTRLLEQMTGVALQRVLTSVNIESNNNDIALKGNVTVGDTILEPDLKFVVDDAKLRRVSGTIQSAAFNLRDFGLNQALQDPADASAATPSAETPSAADASAFDSDQPLPLDQLPDTEIDLLISIGQIYGNVPLATNVETHLTATKQRWALENLQADLPNGLIQLKAALNTAPAQPVWSLAGNIQELQLQMLISELGGGTDIKGSTTAIADLTATGAIPSKMPATLKGTAGFAIENLRLKGAAYDQLATDTVAWFLTGGVLNAETRFSCILGSFDISDGTVKSQALFAESEYMIANGEASFDLQELVADIIITPQSKQRVFQIPGNIEVHGPLNDLSIYTSPVTTGVDTAVQAVTIAPQLAFSLFNKTARVLTGDDQKAVSKELNPCQKAVAVVR